MNFSTDNNSIISTDEDPSLRIESSAIINLRGVSTKLNKYIVFTMQTYKKLINVKLFYLEVLAYWDLTFSFQISRSKRHLDRASMLKFWEALDK